MNRRRSGLILLAAGVVVCVAALIAFSSRPTRAQGETKSLRQLLQAENVPLDAEALHNLDKTITSGAEWNDAAQFAVAYYVSDPTGALTPPMFVDVYDRKTKKWKSGTIEAASAKSEGTDVDCFGSVLSVTATGDYFALETHINPSAGCEIIVSRDLKWKTSLYGWTLAHFGDGGIVFHRSQIHFATVHPAELAFYDPATGKEFSVFPRKPFQQVRLQLTEKLREFFKTQQEYCQKANDPCDPEYFDSSIEGKVATDDRDHAAAFVVSYEQQGFGQDEKKPSGPAQVVYVYRHVNDEAKMEFREMSWNDVKAKVGEVPLEKLVEPAMLEKIFSASAKEQ